MNTSALLDPLDFFEQQAMKFDLTPFLFNSRCQDPNMRAFDSKERFLSWFKQPPGPPLTPDRDQRFYVRELARLSQFTRPDSILEIGTNLGLGTLMLRILNPTATIVSVDNRETVPAADGNAYVVGTLAYLSRCGHIQLIRDSKDVMLARFQMVFIDGDHSYEAVKRDSGLAHNCLSLHRNAGQRSIIWHDYDPDTGGVMRAVDEFCSERNLELYRLHDSATVWVIL